MQCTSLAIATEIENNDEKLPTGENSIVFINQPRLGQHGSSFVSVGAWVRKNPEMYLKFELFGDDWASWQVSYVISEVVCKTYSMIYTH